MLSSFREHGVAAGNVSGGSFSWACPARAVWLLWSTWSARGSCESSVLDSRLSGSEERVRAAKRRQEREEMRTEYDFSAGVRGKYAQRFAAGSRVVVLAPDVAVVFRTARDVNAALRRDIRRRSGGKTSSRRGSSRR